MGTILQFTISDFSKFPGAVNKSTSQPFWKLVKIGSHQTPGAECQHFVMQPSTTFQISNIRNIFSLKFDIF